MTTKKTVLLIVGILAGLSLLIALFVGAVVGVIFYSIGNSEAAQTAKTFLRNNERLTKEIGEVRDFGTFITGSINTRNADGDAVLHLKVEGARSTAKASVTLAYSNKETWRVVGASITNEAGRMIVLLDPYQLEPERRASFHGTSDESFTADVLESPLPAFVKFTKYSAREPVEYTRAFERLAEEYDGEVRCFEFYGEENSEIQRQYKIEVVPTLILFIDSEERVRMRGLPEYAAMSSALERHLR